MESKLYGVYYQTDPTFGFGDRKINLDSIELTHTYLGFIRAEDLDEVFYRMQGDYWSPAGEARNLIKGLGLKHTSMSIGDVIWDIAEDKYHVVAQSGFTTI